MNLSRSSYEKEAIMKWTYVAATVLLIAGCGSDNEQSMRVSEGGTVKVQSGTSGKQSINVENSSDVTASQSGRDNEQSMNVKNSKNVSQNQSGRTNKQTMNVQGGSNVSQNQSGMFNSQSMNIGGSSDDSSDKTKDK